jgi:hypothetical protein
MNILMISNNSTFYIPERVYFQLRACYLPELGVKKYKRSYATAESYVKSHQKDADKEEKLGVTNAISEYLLSPSTVW